MRHTKLWITGADGKIGKALVHALSRDTEYKVLTTDLDVDISDNNAVERFADLNRPNVIINLASIADEMKCEQDPVAAYKVNALGARNLAIASERVNAKIIHISTDEVFSGNNEAALNEFDNTNPITVFGKSKLAGENFIRELNPKHLIIRSSWVYGIYGNNLLTNAISSAKNHEEIIVKENYISSPTCVNDLVHFIISMIENKECGTFHFSSEGSCTRKELIQAILVKYGYDPNIVKEEKSEPYKVLLDNLMLKMTNSYTQSDWQLVLDTFVKENPNV